jgi:hypothetical protein
MASDRSEGLMSVGDEKLAAVREDVVARGEQFYREYLKDRLVWEHRGRFAAIDPDSGRYGLGDTSAEAIGAAHDAMPDARFYLKRIGYTAAHSVGGGLRRED